MNWNPEPDYDEAPDWAGLVLFLIVCVIAAALLLRDAKGLWTP